MILIHYTSFLRRLLNALGLLTIGVLLTCVVLQRLERRGRGSFQINRFYGGSLFWAWWLASGHSDNIQSLYKRKPNKINFNFPHL